MDALFKVNQRIVEYNFFNSQFKYDISFSFQENCGYIIKRLCQQFIGDFVEMRIPEYDPDPKAQHMGVNKIVDYINSTYAFEHKENPSTDNGSSRKQNLKKLKEYAARENLIPIYAYTQERAKKNSYVKDGILHVHGKEIFNLLGIMDKYNNFIDDIEVSKKIIIDQLRKQFNEYYSEFAT